MVTMSLFFQFVLLKPRTLVFRSLQQYHRALFFSSPVATRTYATTHHELIDSSRDDDDHDENTRTAVAKQRIESKDLPCDPWNHPRVIDQIKRMRIKNKLRFRQHVNPLASQYQRPVVLPENWPSSSFDDLSKPLHLDIGCGKGGFLLNLVASESRNSSNGGNDDASLWPRNYLGLEIRPLVARYARERLQDSDNKRNRNHSKQHGAIQLKGRLDFLGCNANIDLDRILSKYQNAYTGEHLQALERVTVQFPDPHFKSQHAKRRVVTARLVETIARHLLPTTGIVFIQSDVRSVLDDVRSQFALHPHYFHDSSNSPDEYIPVEENIFGVPTERETSVLMQGLPVYRAMFLRTKELFHSNPGMGIQANNGYPKFA